MDLIINRDENGLVESGSTSCEIPQDMSMLDVLGNNPMIDLATYAKDGWVYVNGNRVRKWFQRWDRINVWPPVFEDVVTLEARRWKVFQKVNKFYYETWKPLFDELAEVGQAHAKPNHKYKGDKKWWLYKSRFEELYKSNYLSFDWVDEPETKLNLEIGQKYYNVDRKMRRYYGYAGKFRTILTEAINRYLSDKCKAKKDGITLKLVINGRIYWYTSVMSIVGFKWEKVSWPDDNMIEVVL